MNSIDSFIACTEHCRCLLPSNLPQCVSVTEDALTLDYLGDSAAALKLTAIYQDVGILQALSCVAYNLFGVSCVSFRENGWTRTIERHGLGDVRYSTYGCES